MVAQRKISARFLTALRIELGNAACLALLL